MRATSLLLIGLLSGWSFASAQGSDAPARESPDEERSARLERWRSLTPAQRELLRERFEDYKRMDEAGRGELRRRLERLRDVERDVHRELPPDVRERLQGLDCHERRELLHEHLVDELFARGRRMRGLLPDELRQQLEQAPPEQRERLVAELRARCEREELSEALRDLSRELALAPQVVEDLLAQPIEAQREKVLELKRVELTQRVQREGLAPWITREEWEAWRSLSDRDFFERLGRARRKQRGGGELRHLLRPEPQWLAELAPLPPDERRPELERRLRARALDYLDRHPELLQPGELESLRALEGCQLMGQLRKRFQGQGGSSHHERGRDRGHRGEGEGGEGRSEHPREQPPGAPRDDGPGCDGDSPRS